MQSQIRLSQSVQDLLCCPICHARLNRKKEQFNCTNLECDALFPIVDGIPILINEQSSLFSISELVSHKRLSSGNVHENKLKKTLRLIPTIGKNIKSGENYSRLSSLLLKKSNSPKALVIGGGVLGAGMESIAKNSSIYMVESDVSFGPRTVLICDGQDIPFQDESFDGVIIQAVLDDVVDPYKCSEEIYRVLKKQGIVYAETPFMQQVHSGRYDFTRFSHLGHRRLFRRFEEIDSGAVCGPGMALAWSYKYFLMSFTTSKILRSVAKNFASMTSFYLKYFDYYLINKPGALDAASGYYFMGTKGDKVLSDRDLIKLYRGAEG